MSIYEMKMNLNVLNHLGINLYSNIPAVLSEIVANAWDADATEVSIEIIDDGIMIKDNGCGMSVEDINEKFLMVGYQKRENGCSTTPKYKRKVMGRKGIGKLSLFSIAYDVEIYSKKEEDINGLKINVKELESKIKDGQNKYNPEELNASDSGIIIEGTGTTIVLKDLKKRKDIRTPEYLKKRLARRFSIIGSKNNFLMKVNNDEITLSDRGYFTKLESIWTFGSDELEGIDYSKINNFNLINEFQGTDDYEDRNFKISGWIGSVNVSGDLKDGNENLNKLSLLIRGKIAQEDILPLFPQAGLFTKYLIGEIHADFLDDDTEEDITTSGRQSIKEDEERFKQLLSFLNDRLKEIGSQWTKTRNDDGTDEALRDTAIRKWFDSLGSTENDKKKKARSLFGKINQLTLEPAEKNELFKQSVLAFEIMRYKDNLDGFDKLTPDNLTEFNKLFVDLSDIEATLYYQIVAERIRIIEKLDQNKDKNVLEKLMQEHVFENLWLLDPSWDRATGDQRLEVIMKKELEDPSILTVDEQRARLDIKYKRSSGKHIIIELKRANVNIDIVVLLKQIKKYKIAFKKVLRQQGETDPDFEIICLVGKTPNSWIESDEREGDIEMLKTQKAKLITYDELITNALSQYKEYFDSHREANRLNEIIGDINLSD